MRGGSRRDQSWTDSFNLATRCSVLECPMDWDGFTGGGWGWGSSGVWPCCGSGADPAARRGRSGRESPEQPGWSSRNKFRKALVTNSKSLLSTNYVCVQIYSKNVYKNIYKNISGRGKSFRGTSPLQLPGAPRLTRRESWRTSSGRERTREDILFVVFNFIWFETWSVSVRGERSYDRWKYFWEKWSKYFSFILAGPPRSVSWSWRLAELIKVRKKKIILNPEYHLLWIFSDLLKWNARKMKCFWECDIKVKDLTDLTSDSIYQETSPCQSNTTFLWIRYSHLCLTDGDLGPFVEDNYDLPSLRIDLEMIKWWLKWNEVATEETYKNPNELVSQTAAQWKPFQRDED